MSFFKRFAFWLPFLSVIHFIYEMLFNPIKDIVLAIDPLLGFLFKLFNGFVYNYESHLILFPGFLLHFVLWLLYGFIIDCILKNSSSIDYKKRGDKRNDSYN